MTLSRLLACYTFISWLYLVAVKIIGFLVLLQTCYSFGYGFVNYLTEEGAQRAIKSLNGITVRNKRLKVNCFFLNENFEISELLMFTGNI